MEISRELLEKVIKRAFDRGEQWGIEYSSWLPTRERRDDKEKEALEECLILVTNRRVG